MKKIILFLIVFLGFYQTSFSADIIYVNNDDSGYIYKKSDTNTGVGSPITSTAGRFPFSSADGSSVYYRNSSDGNKMYKKSSSDTSNGSAITTSSYTSRGSESPDGQYVIYRNDSDGGKMYRKDANDTSNGVEWSEVPSNYGVDVSNDGASLLYRRASDGYILQKNIADISTGIVMINTDTYDATYSPDGGSVASGNGSMRVIDFLNTIIYDTPVSGYDPAYLRSSTPTTTATCSDGIQNQNETSVDRGGVCGGNPSFYFSGYLCNWKEIQRANNDFSDYYTIGDLSDFSYSTGGTQSVYQWSDTTGKDYDYFEFNGLSYDEVYTGSLVGLYTSSDLSLIRKDPDAENQYGFNIKIESGRNNELIPINYVAVRATPGKGPGEVVFYEKNGTYIERQGFESTGSGIYVAQARNTTKKAYKVMIASLPVSQGFPFWGIKIGDRETSKIFVPYCNADKWNCVVNDQGNICSMASLNILNNNACGFTTLSGTLAPPGICMPTLSEEEAYSGATQTNGYDINYEEEDIFTCTESGLSVLICPFQVVAKVWGKFTIVIKKLVNLIYGISSLGSPSGQGNIFSFIPVSYAGGIELSTPFDISGSGNSSESYTGSDMMDLNKTILKASDNVFAMDSKGIKGIYAMSMWFLILAGVVTVIVIFIIAFK